EGRGQVAGRARAVAAHGCADGRARGHQGARRLPGHGGTDRHHDPRPGHDGERLLAPHRGPERADRPRRAGPPGQPEAVTMSFSRWLRATSEHYLMVAAPENVAAKYHLT